MAHLSKKQSAELREGFVKNLSLDSFENDEIEYLLAEIDSYAPPVRQKILALSLALSHASSSLVPRALKNIKRASSYLPPADLERWVSAAFDLLDSPGMEQAFDFLSRVKERDLRGFQARKNFHLTHTAPLLETYLRALSGREVKIAGNDETYTDTVNFFLPSVGDRFPEPNENFLLYKIAAGYVWGQLALGTLTLNIDVKTITERFPDYPLDHPDIETFFGFFGERELSLDLYTIIESFRIDQFLIQEVPGLMKQAAAIKSDLYQERVKLSSLPEKAAFVEGLWQYYLMGTIKGEHSAGLVEAISSLTGIRPGDGLEVTVRLLFRLYDAAASLEGDYAPRPAPLFIGRVRPERIAARLRQLKEERAKKIQTVLARLIEMPDFMPDEAYGKKSVSQEAPVDPSKEYLLIKGKLMELDDDLKSLINEKGAPGGILVKGSQLGGGSAYILMEPDTEKETDTAGGGLKYDEWDYRRGGYKKDWCNLYENDIPPGDKLFVYRTLKRYSGHVAVLRKKFEMLKRERRTQRRQKDGEDIDFDAAVETFSDMRAGVCCSENLFTRTDRQERNIAVLFLVDMSGSTTGWVNQSEKESLVLMLEALETLGDRYAVYGFSGMTRNRCDLYRVKGFEEGYDETIKRRIAGITTKDYTRMGPFIRHAAGLLRMVDARTKLLITLSDGKPEDWDGYKGDYAVEDTRKALIEARVLGIHPFCITIDREAQSYLPHMFGQGSYIFIDDVRKLPNRITEIYRRLTT